MQDLLTVLRLKDPHKFPPELNEPCFLYISRTTLDCVYKFGISKDPVSRAKRARLLEKRLYKGFESIHEFDHRWQALIVEQAISCGDTPLPDSTTMVSFINESKGQEKEWRGLWWRSVQNELGTQNELSTLSKEQLNAAIDFYRQQLALLGIKRFWLWHGMNQMRSPGSWWEWVEGKCFNSYRMGHEVPWWSRWSNPNKIDTSNTF